MLNFITVLSRGALRPYGGLSNCCGTGGSEAKARAPRESMIRFTHSSCVYRSGLCEYHRAPHTHSVTAEMFTVSWNCRNFEMLS